MSEGVARCWMAEWTLRVVPRGYLLQGFPQEFRFFTCPGKHLVNFTSLQQTQCYRPQDNLAGDHRSGGVARCWWGLCDTLLVIPKGLSTPRLPQGLHGFSNSCPRKPLCQFHLFPRTLGTISGGGGGHSSITPQAPGNPSTYTPTSTEPGTPSKCS